MERLCRLVMVLKIVESTMMGILKLEVRQSNKYAQILSRAVEFTSKMIIQSRRLVVTSVKKYMSVYGY